ncbi:MAG: hypothetical protein IMF16_00535, partial [Proteobacteria bacterium]|nr:hypothetical protein [Pseudomonadota bacterium]
AGSLASRATLDASGALTVEGNLILSGGTTRVASGTTTIDLGSLNSNQHRMITAGHKSSRMSMVQFTGDTTPSGYGVWMNFNAYLDNEVAGAWHQPRGDLGGYLYTVNYHRGFAWHFAVAGGSDDGAITPTLIAAMNSSGDLTVKGHYEVDGTYVVRNRQAAVAHYVLGDNLADLGAKFNALLDRLEPTGHGLLGAP